MLLNRHDKAVRRAYYHLSIIRAVFVVLVPLLAPAMAGLAN
jgi:hypothetical protein